eukprot:g6999.t1
MAQRISKDSVSKQFVRLYYSILNTHHEHLHQFYGKSSTVVVSEMLDSGETMTETAEEEETCRELLKWLYEDVTVKVDSAVPQFSIEGCVLLLVNGTMFRKSHKDERLFTQALLLAPQDNGYFIRTDSLHVLSRGPSDSASGEESRQPTGFVWDDKEASGCESPKTPRTEIVDRALRQGTESGRTSVEITSQGNGREIQTTTPPPQENCVDASKSSGSDADVDEYRPYLNRTLSHPTCDAVHPQVMRHTIPPPMHSMPPMMMPNMHMVPHMNSMAMGMPPTHPGLRRRSVSMSCDIRTMQPTSGHGVFIARLPFGIQARDVAEAFQEFGPIVGGVDGIQVRDGRNGCYAFVNFVSSSSAETAIQKGATLQGKRVYVEPRYQRSETEMVFPMPVVSEHARPPLPMPRRAS